MSLLRTHLSRATRTVSHGYGLASVQRAAAFQVGGLRSHHDDAVADSPLNADKQSKTGEQPSYGPIGVTAALKYHHEGTSPSPSPSPFQPCTNTRHLLRSAPADASEPPTPTLFAHEFSLADRVALISGANRGLGLEMALALIEAGARAVYCVDLAKDPSPEFLKVREYANRLSGKGGEGRMEYISGDVTDQVGASVPQVGVLAR